MLKLSEPTVILYRPCGQKELDLVATSGFKHRPPRLLRNPFSILSLMNKHITLTTQINKNLAVASKARSYLFVGAALSREFAEWLFKWEV